MFRLRHAPKTNARRGIILLVVLALLTLFAIVGLSFVLYANSEADNSRVYLEAQGVIPNNGYDVPADQLLSYALGQCLFDVEDRPGMSNTDLYSAMRGHSLARDMYGWDSDSPGSNIFPFNGTGRLHGNVTSAAADDYNLINYTYYPGDGFIRDPERVANRTGASAQNAALQPYVGGWNSPYTYPDLNHCYLAAVDSNGNVLTPSFVRNWNGFGPMDPSNPNWNVPSSTNPMLKYMVMRPRPADMGPGFPLPASPTGDVQNAVGITNGPDSFWMDLDYPEQTAPDGTKYKPLFAFLIMDLDNHINLNVAGNTRANGNGHFSSRGYGPWEINPRKLPDAGGTSGNEWPNLYVGYQPPAPAQRINGRYGPDQQPGKSGSAASGGPMPHVYAQEDFDGSNEGSGGAATAQFTMPTTTAPFPSFPAGYGNRSAPELLNHPLLYNFFNPTANGADDRRFPSSDMQLLLNNGANGILWKSSNFGQLCPTLFGSAQLRKLVTTDSYDVNRPGLAPWLWDTTSGAPSNATNPNNYTVSSPPYGPASGAPVALPSLALRTSTAVPGSSEFRSPGQAPTTGTGASNPNVEWRSALASSLAKIDLNRFLPPYPHLGKWTLPSPPDPTNPSGWVFYNGTPGTAEVAYGSSYTSDPAAVTQYKLAEGARQGLANDIYRCFLAVTGVPAPANPASPTDAELAPRRYLAQLAVNIVDYIDDDEISTPFNFYTAGDAGNPTGFNVMATAANPTGANELLQYWVYGTELPRVVLNEVYAEYQQPVMGSGMTATGMAGPFPVRVWAELHNPLPNLTPTPAGAQPQDASAVPLYISAGASGYAPYQVVIASTNNNANAHGLLLPAAGQNVLGTPDTASTPGSGVRAQTVDSDFGVSPTPVIGAAPSNGFPSLKPQDVLVLGPTGSPAVPAPGSFMAPATGGPDVEGTINAQGGSGTPNGQVPSGKQYLTTPNMQYAVQVGYDSTNKVYTTWTDPTTSKPKDDRYTAPNGGITVLLRRLADPYLPPQTDPTQPNYNPFITVDYMDHVNLNDYTPLAAPYSPPFPFAATTTPPRPSRAKKQPYAADFNEIADETDPNGVTQTTPTQHSLGVAPNTSKPPSGNYDWLVHLDRQLISTGELLQVSGFAPFLLTHQFITGPAANPVKFTHRAPWFDEQNLGVASGQSSRLYRALEFLDVHSRAAGVGFVGRVPGKVNINTVWDAATFQALCDRASGNFFTDNDVSTVWNNILTSRQNPGPAARPFMGMAAPNSPGGDPWFPSPPPTNPGGPYSATNPGGINDTLLRSVGAPGTPPLFQVSSLPHPYLQDELLTKILNNVTTRSNVFAMWITVGFFQVVQDKDAAGNPVLPIKLGAELGANTGTNIRHRMFAIVDRSSMAIDMQLTDAGGNPVQLGAVNQPSNSLSPQTVNISATSGTTKNTNIPWSIGPGTVLLINPGQSDREAVLVTAVNGTQITATFQQGHAAGAKVTIPGNPGPSPPKSPPNPMYFDVNNLNPMYKDVVLYYAILQ